MEYGCFDKSEKEKMSGDFIKWLREPDTFKIVEFKDEDGSTKWGLSIQNDNSNYRELMFNILHTDLGRFILKYKDYYDIKRDHNSEHGLVFTDKSMMYSYINEFIEHFDKRDIE